MFVMMLLIVAAKPATMELFHGIKVLPNTSEAVMSVTKASTALWAQAQLLFVQMILLIMIKIHLRPARLIQ